jgi:hypothetical protein
MSVRSTFGAAQDAHGRWKNELGENSFDLIALRQVVVGRVAGVLADPRIQQRLKAIQVMLAGREVQRETPVGAAAGDVGAHLLGCHIHPADGVDELWERG